MARGVLVFGGDVLECARTAAAADAAGVAAVWTAEFYTRSATISLAAMATSTTRCTIGSSIAYGIGRTPMVLMAEARDLDTLSGGRLILGLGNGTPRMQHDWHGLTDTAAPAVRMEELVTVLRKLFRLHEGPVRHSGRFYHLDLEPTAEVPAPIRPVIPIYTAGVNPRMVETAGRVSDGVLLHPVAGTRYVEEVARPAVERGALRAEREPSDIRIVVSPICSVSTDVEQARREAAAQIAFYSVSKAYMAVHEANGFTAHAMKIRDRFIAGDTAGMINAVPDEMIDALALAGTESDVRAGLRRYEQVADDIQLYAPSFGLEADRIAENTRSLIQLCTDQRQPASGVARAEESR